MPNPHPTTCLPTTANVRALRDALSELTIRFGGFPLPAHPASRDDLRGDLLYRAILRNPAEVFRVFLQFSHYADMRPEDAARSEQYRFDTLALFLRWQDLPLFRFCAFHKRCGLRAGYVLAAGEVIDDDWSTLRFSQAPWLVCDQPGCRNTAAQREGLTGKPRTYLPADIGTLISMVGQEFTDAALADRLRTSLILRRALYSQQEAFGDQIVRCYDIQGRPYGTSKEDLWRARKFFKIAAPT